MRAGLVVCLLLVLALQDASAKKRPNTKKNPRPRRSIWSKIRQNAADVKKLTTAIDETQKLQQDFSPVMPLLMDTLKEKMDDMKDVFASMKTGMNDMKALIENLQKTIGTETGPGQGSGSPPGIYAEY